MKNLTRLTTVLLALVMMVACGAEKEVAEPLTQAPSFASMDEAKAAANGKLILVDFYTDW